MRPPEEKPPSRSRWLAPLSALALAVILSACSGGGGPSVAVQLDQAALDVILGSGSAVQVSVTRSAGATAAKALHASGAPEWVSVDFAPAVLADATLASTMTVTTDAAHPDAEPTTFDLTVQAVGAGLSGQAVLSVSVDLLDVAGVVVGGLGEPQVGLSVVASGGLTATTDSAGAFGFADMAVPYDLTIVDHANSVGHRFEGLTVAAPRLQPALVVFSGVGGTLSATVSGTFSHATFVPLPADHGISVCVEGLNGTALGCGPVTVAGQSTYDLDVNWSTPAEISVRIRSYVYAVDAAGVPTAIVASGISNPLSLADGDVEVVDLALTATSSQASLSVTTNAPGGFTVDNRSVVSHYADLASFGLRTGTSLGVTGTHIAPYFPGATLTAYAIAMPDDPTDQSTSVAWSTGHAAGDATTLALPMPATLVAPAGGVADVSTATDFTIANPAGGVMTFVFQPAGAPGPSFAVTTAATSARIPALAAFGMPVPAAAAYAWAVLASVSVPTADAAVTGDGYLGSYVNLALATFGGGFAPAADGQLTMTDSRVFTTQ